MQSAYKFHIIAVQVYEHPRFGLVPCITSLTDIPAGQELLVLDTNP